MNSTDGHAGIARSRFLERGVLTALLVAGFFRALYHLSYLDHPFSVTAIADGRTLEFAARDAAWAFPLGRAPIELVSLYGHVMSLPLIQAPWLAFVLAFQILLAVIALALFYRTATRAFGMRAGAFSTLLLMSYPTLMFFENKFGAVELTVVCTVLVVWGFEHAAGGDRMLRFAGVGAATGSLLLCAPGTLFAVPFVGVAVLLAQRERGRPVAPALVATTAGLVLICSAMALRNLTVAGRAEVFGRHAISIPLFIGNNPHADGRYNDAGGMIDRSKPGGRAALSAALGVRSLPVNEFDDAIDDALYQRTRGFLDAEPGRALQLLGLRAFHATGNAEPTEHYDRLGEAAMLSPLFGYGVPFGLLMALGALGFALMRDGRLAHPRARVADRPLVWLLTGLCVGPIVTMLLGYASAEQRVPMAVPLAFAAGPALLVVLGVPIHAEGSGRRPGRLELALAAGLLLQAFIPRSEATGPSAWHYYYLGEVSERIGSLPAAVEHYSDAVRRDPRQPLFLLRQAQLLMLLLQMESADVVLARFERLDDVTPSLAREGYAARLKLDTIKARWIRRGRWRAP